MNHQRMRPQSGKTYSSVTSSEHKKYPPSGPEFHARQPQTPQSHHFRNQIVEDIRTDGAELMKPFYSPKESILASASASHSRQNSTQSGAVTPMPYVIIYKLFKAIIN